MGQPINRVCQSSTFYFPFNLDKLNLCDYPGLSLLSKTHHCNNGEIDSIKMLHIYAGQLLNYTWDYLKFRFVFQERFCKFLKRSRPVKLTKKLEITKFMSEFMSLKIKNATVMKDYGRNSDFEWLYSFEFTMVYNL